MRMKTKKMFGNVMWWVVILFVVLLVIYPPFLGLYNSLRGLYDSATYTMPQNPHWENYKLAVTMIPYGRYLKNSLIMVAIKVFFTLSLDFIFAYAFAVLKARGRQTLYMVVLSQMMIPAFALSIPTYITMRALNLTGTRLILILTGLAGDAYRIFWYKQFIENVSKDLQDAAFIDGCGFFGVIYRIYAPMCKNALVLSAYGAYVTAWNNYMTPYMYFKEELYPLSIVLISDAYTFYDSQSKNPEPIKMAAAMMFMLPAIVLYYVSQMLLEDEVSAGGVKG